MDSNLRFKIILGSIIFGIILFNFIFKFIFFCLIKMKIYFYDLDIEFFIQEKSIFFDSFTIFNKIKYIRNREELNSLIIKTKEKHKNPYKLNIIKSIQQNDNSENRIQNNIYENSILNLDANLHVNIENPFIDNNENINCIICFDEDKIDDIVLLECEHKFHLQCINNWIKVKNECPLCKKNIVKY